MKKYLIILGVFSAILIIGFVAVMWRDSSYPGLADAIGISIAFIFPLLLIAAAVIFLGALHKIDIENRTIYKRYLGGLQITAGILYLLLLGSVAHILPENLFRDIAQNISPAFNYYVKHQKTEDPDLDKYQNCQTCNLYMLCNNDLSTTDSTQRRYLLAYHSLKQALGKTAKKQTDTMLCLTAFSSERMDTVWQGQKMNTLIMLKFKMADIPGTMAYYYHCNDSEGICFSKPLLTPVTDNDLEANLMERMSKEKDTVKLAREADSLAKYMIADSSLKQQ